MLKKISFFLLLTLGQLTVRAQAVATTDSLVFSTFPTQASLSLEPMFRYKDGTARRIFLLDSSLFVWNGQGGQDYFFYQYSLTGEKISGGYIKGGTGKNEVMGAMSAGVLNNTLWVHDISLNKLVTVELEKTPTGMVAKKTMDYRLPLFLYSVEVLDSARIIGAGSEDALYKLQEIAIPSGQQLNGLGAYDTPPAGIPFNSWKRAHEGFVFTNPARNKALIATRFTDRVELFDLATRKSRMIRGPENFAVIFNPIYAAGRDMMERTEETRFAFITGTTTEKYIYLLFSGEKDGTPHVSQGKYIYIYDWAGNPVKKLNLDRFINCFVVAEDNRTLYAYSKDTGMMLRSIIAL